VWGILEFDLLTPVQNRRPSRTEHEHQACKKESSQQAMVEAEQTWGAWSREEGEDTEGGKQGFIGVT